MLMTRGLRLHVGAVGDKEFRAVVTLIFGGFFFFWKSGRESRWNEGESLSIHFFFGTR